MRILIATHGQVISIMIDRPVLIAAGGTGGHVFPGLAVAMELHNQDVPVIWVGTEKGIESRVVPEWGVPMRMIRVTSLRGRGILSSMRSVLNLVSAVIRSLQIILTVRPRVVLGMGGYVAGPVCLAARVSGYKMMLHEQNAVAGFTNRCLRRFANRVMEAMPGAFGASASSGIKSVIYTGNPVRNDILNVDSPQQRMVNRDAIVNVLVIGGSQGAKALNELVPEATKRVSGALSILHQAGGSQLQVTQAAYANCEHQYQVKAFVDDMAEAYEWADLIICRAGAMTVAEVAAVGLAAILVPYPAAVDDHQTANAKSLVEAGAAVLMQESDITVEKLAVEINDLIADRKKLLDMALRGREASRRDATSRVVEELLGEVA